MLTVFIMLENGSVTTVWRWHECI